MSEVTHHRIPSINTDVYARLKLMIASGELPPGARLVQQGLAKQMGTSAMPVIEALRRLERDGLVTHVPHFGSFVRESNVDELRELFCIRLMETEACRMFVQRATPEEKQALIDLNNRMNAAATVGNVEDLYEADLKFHLHIAKCAHISRSQVSRLVEIIQNRQIEEQLFRNRPELQTGSTESLVGLHDPIVDAIIAGDEERAARAIRQHIFHTERQYLKNENTFTD